MDSGENENISRAVSAGIRIPASLCILFTFCFNLIGQNGGGAPNISPLNITIDSLIQGAVDKDSIPGAVILITVDHRQVLRKAYGYVMKYDYAHEPVNPPEKMTPDDLFDSASLPLKYPVGHERHYSDLGFIILGAIIENLTDLPLDVFMEKNIFGPLGMNSTTFNPLSRSGPSKITATSAGNPYEKRMVYDPSLGYSVKGIYERCASRFLWSHRIHRYQYHCYSSEENFCHYIDQQTEHRVASIGQLL